MRNVPNPYMQIKFLDMTLFNINCVDKFQSLGVPTLLFEAGHYGNDYIETLLENI